MAAVLQNSNRRLAWLSFLLFFIGFVLFFVAYTGHAWYRTPDDHSVYPPDTPDKKNPISMGLFWMCANGHCKFDLRVDYMVVKHIQDKSKQLQDAFQNYRTMCMAIETVAACFCLASLALNLIFLSDFRVSRIMGFVAGGAEFIAGIIALIGLIIYGSKFRDTTESLPYGWSFWMMLAALIILLVDGVLTAVISAFSAYKTSKLKQSDVTRPLASGF